MCINYKGSEDRQVCCYTSQICLNTLTCGYWKPIVRAIKACTHVFLEPKDMYSIMKR